MTLEDFHTKALHLVTKAGHTGGTKDRVLRDTIISGISSDKIRGKIVKEGKDVSISLSHGNSKIGSFHTESFGQNARDCQDKLCTIWQIN